MLYRSKTHKYALRYTQVQDQFKYRSKSHKYTSTQWATHKYRSKTSTGVYQRHGVNTSSMGYGVLRKEHCRGWAKRHSIKSGKGEEKHKKKSLRRRVSNCCYPCTAVWYATNNTRRVSPASQLLKSLSKESRGSNLQHPTRQDHHRKRGGNC